MGVQYFGLIKDETQPHSFLVSSDINRGYRFFVNLAAFDAKKGPLVWAVVAIESLRCSFAKNNPSKEHLDILKGLFKVKRTDGRWLAQIVFHDICDHCLSILRQRKSTKEDHEDALCLLKTIVALISSCELVIKHTGHYEKLCKRGLDWERTTAEV